MTYKDWKIVGLFYHRFSGYHVCCWQIIKLWQWHFTLKKKKIPHWSRRICQILTHGMLLHLYQWKHFLLTSHLKLRTDLSPNKLSIHHCCSLNWFLWRSTYAKSHRMGALQSLMAGLNWGQDTGTVTLGDLLSLNANSVNKSTCLGLIAQAK